MSNYNVSGKEFIRRTLDIFNERQRKYPVTAMINIGFCIIVMAHEVCDAKLKDATINLEDYGITSGNLTKCDDERGNEKRSFDNIIRHLRNSIAHWDFKYNLSGERIKEIYFEDKTENQINFRILFSDTDFKNLKLYDGTVSNINIHSNINRSPKNEFH